MKETPNNVLDQMLNDYDALARDLSTSPVTRNRLLKEIGEYRQLIKSEEARDDDLYAAIKDIYVDIQIMMHDGNLDSALSKKRGDIFSRIKKAAEFYVNAKGSFTYQIKTRILFFPELDF